MLYNPLNQKSTSFSNDPRQWPAKAEVKEYFGERVLWHTVGTEHDDDNDGGRHVPSEHLEEYRRIGDPLVDRIFELREAEGQPVKAGDDLLAMAEETAAASRHNNNNDHQPALSSSSSSSERALHDFYQIHHANHKLPSWVDPQALERGQQVYLAYLPAISMALYYRSLVPGFSIPRIAAVIQSTGYLAPPSPRQEVFNRLMDTGLLLMHSFCSLEDILPGGKGWKACLQVRFLHAKVRRGLLRRRGARAWDVDKLGIPINEEDMAATLLAFALNPLLGIEMIMGFPVPERDRLDYLAVWRYLGWLMGVPVLDEVRLQADENDPLIRHRANGKMPRPLDPCGPGWIISSPNPFQHSSAILQSIIFHLMHPDESSVKVANYLLQLGGRSTDVENPKTRAQEESWYYYRALQCRRFVGDPLADALQLPLPKSRFERWRQRTVSTVALFVWTIYSWAGLPWSPFRPLLVRCHRYYLNKIGENVQTTHAKRMQDKLDRQPSCPFAMVAPPVH